MLLGFSVDIPSIMMTFAWRSLTMGAICPLASHVQRLSPLFGPVQPLHAISQTRSVCAIKHPCLCSYPYLYYLGEKYFVDVPKLVKCHPRDRARSLTLVMLPCGFLGRSNRNNYLLVLVMRALATSTHGRTYLPKQN